MLLLRFLPLALFGTMTAAGAFADYTEVLELTPGTSPASMSIKPAKGELRDVLSTIMNHSSERWTNGLQRLPHDKPFLVKGLDGKLLCITHYIAGQTGEIKTRRRSFDTSVLDSKDPLPLTFIGMRSQLFFKEIEGAKLSTPTLQTVTPSRHSGSGFGSPIESQDSSSSFTLLTVPFSGLRRHSTGTIDCYPKRSLVRFPNPLDRYSLVCGGEVDGKSMDDGIEIPRTSVVFVVRPWDEVKSNFPKPPKLGQTVTTLSTVDSSTPKPSEDENWVSGEDFDFEKGEPKAKRTLFKDVSDDDSTPPSKKSLTLIKKTHKMLLSEGKKDLVAQFLWECYGNQDATLQASLIKSSLQRIFDMERGESDEVRKVNSPKRESSRSRLSLDERLGIESEPYYYIDPRDVPENITRVAAALMVAGGKELLDKSTKVVAWLFRIPLVQARGVMKGLECHEQLQIYCTYTMEIFKAEMGIAGLAKLLAEHFQIPVELAGSLIPRILIEAYGNLPENYKPLASFDPTKLSDEVVELAKLLISVVDTSSVSKGLDSKEFPEVLENPAAVISQLYRVPLIQAKAVLRGILANDPLWDYKAFLKDKDSTSSTLELRTKWLTDEFSIPSDVASKVAVEYFTDSFVIIKSKLPTSFNPLKPDQSIIKAAAGYLSRDLSGMFNSHVLKEETENAKFIAAALVMHSEYENLPFAQAFALMLGIKFKDPLYVYKTVVEELLRARNQYKVSEKEAKPKILSALKSIFFLDDKSIEDIYNLVKKAPEGLEYENQSKDLSRLDIYVDAPDVLGEISKPIHSLCKEFSSGSWFRRIELIASLQKILHINWLSALDLIPDTRSGKD